ncbi:MAG: radical SAM protein [Sedimenticola sp.]
MRDGLIITPCYEHTLAAYYINSLLRSFGAHPVCIDLEYFLARDQPETLRLLSRTFQSYDLNPSYSVDFVSRLELQIKTLCSAEDFKPQQHLSGYELQLFTELQPFIQRWSDEILSHSLGRLMFPVINRNLWFALLLVRTLRDKGFNGQVIFGGPGVSHPAVAQWIEALALIDDVVTGDGFQGLSSVTEHFQPKGLSAEDLQRMIAENRLLPSPLGFPAPGLEFRSYWSVALPTKQFLPVTGSFGCRYSCEFCYDSGTSFYLRREASQVAAEITAQAGTFQYGIFGFCDPTLNSEAGWLEELCEHLLASGRQFQFRFAHIRADKLSSQAITLMKKAGFVHLNMGLESTDVKTCLRMGKGYKNKQTPATAVEEALAGGLPVSINLFSNYPGMSEHEFEQTRQGAEALLFRLQQQKTADQASFTVHPTRIDPVSRLYARHIAPLSHTVKLDLPHSMSHLRSCVDTIAKEYRDKSREFEQERFDRLSAAVSDANLTTEVTPIEVNSGVLTLHSHLLAKADIQWHYRPSEEDESEGELIASTNEGFAVDRLGKHVFDTLMAGVPVGDAIERLEAEFCSRHTCHDSVFEIATALLNMQAASLPELAEQCNAAS